MAIHRYEQADDEGQTHLFPLDSLFCEEKWGEEEEDKAEVEHTHQTHLFSLGFLEEDLSGEDERLLSMLSKETEQLKQSNLELEVLLKDPSVSAARSSAVEWMLKVQSHYGFSTLTAILAVAYFDRFLLSLHFKSDKPWMSQLVAVTCLSLASKVEEIEVPLLLDLQVEDAKYVFEAKTIQRMELLVLSTLQWRMHLVTPYSFLDHIVRRLGLKSNLHLEFFRRSEHLLISQLSDSRFVGYLPSILATATMMGVIDQLEPHMSLERRDQLLGVLKIDKEKVQCCYNLVKEHSKAYGNGNGIYHPNTPHKRKHEQQAPDSPSGVIDAGFTSDSSDDSWALKAASVCSSPEPSFKKSKTEEPKMKFHSLNRPFLDIVGSPS
ncbi:cyclin-D3-3-like [Cucurbita moschata]|uniref:B-like cyclin n=1 Tax=Cucurbita moschata TaxID=3662 RepID=A0A6J1E752_CUCMO|nr:cyclin-D3-3-like [Cucurbita moschata]XP_022922594.1 cyclin-D3-3-like [Cucurbita moschata]XP_022922595.1 cyclin-D3-3-like [Cucurbita moschata]